MKRKIGILFWLIWLTSGVLACQVPVFRFALERWPADHFRLLVTSQGPLQGELKQELAYLETALSEKSQRINLELEVIDLEALSEQERISIEGLEHAGENARMILMPPESWKSEDPAWVGEASAENLARLLDSPVRQKCVQHLMKGESAVWILVESGDAEKDSQARALLTAGLAQASSTIELPEGVIRREDLNRNLENIDPDNILRSDLPLKISFAMETVSRDDREESLFLPILVEPELLGSGEPLIVPVFGRGRTPGGLPISQASVDRIVGACEYLCGACSCQVKEGNPGYDLLVKASWDDLLQGEVLTASSKAVQDALDVATFEPPSASDDEVVLEQRPGWMVPVLVGACVLVVLVAGWGILGTRMSKA